MKFQIEVIKSKIHRVTVTQANLNYVGSITIDEALMEAANMIEGEKVQILDINNGERFETYIIRGERGSGCICLNGAAARKVQVGDVVIIASYALLDFEDAKQFKPWIVFPDTATNRLIRSAHRRVSSASRAHSAAPRTSPHENPPKTQWKRFRLAGRRTECRSSHAEPEKRFPSGDPGQRRSHGTVLYWEPFESILSALRNSVSNPSAS